MRSGCLSLLGRTLIDNYKVILVNVVVDIIILVLNGMRLLKHWFVMIDHLAHLEHLEELHKLRIVHIL
jgi:hypothetical protein